MTSHTDAWSLLQQAKRILAGIFSRIAEGFAEPLTAALSHAAQAEPAAPGAFQGLQWPGADAEEPSLLEGPAARKRQKLGYSTRRRVAAEVSQIASGALAMMSHAPLPGRPAQFGFRFHNVAWLQGMLMSVWKSQI